MKDPHKKKKNHEREEAQHSKDYFVVVQHLRGLVQTKHKFWTKQSCRTSAHVPQQDGFSHTKNNFVPRVGGRAGNRWVPTKCQAGSAGETVFVGGLVGRPLAFSDCYCDKEHCLAITPVLLVLGS